MFNKLQSLRKSNFVRSVLTMAAGTAGAQAVTMALAPIITRQYGPEAFGILGLFSALLMILAAVAALAYPMAIVMPEKASEARALIRLSVYLSLVLSSIVGGAIFICGDWLLTVANLAKNESATPLLWLLPLAMMLMSFQQIFEQSLIRDKQFKSLARTAFFHSILINCVKVIAGYFYPIASALIFIQTASGGVHALILWMFYRSSATAKKNKRNGQDSLLSVLNRYRDFAVYRAPEVAINAVSHSLPVLLLAYYFSPAAAGFYTLSRTVLGMPTMLLGKSVGDVFYPRIAEAANNGEPLYSYVAKTTFWLFAVGAIPFGIVILLGPTLFQVAFGAEWGGAGDYARWIALWLLCAFANSPCVKVLPVLGEQKLLLLFTLIGLVVRTGALVIANAIYADELTAIASFCLAGALVNIMLIKFTLEKCSKLDDARNSISVNDSR